MYKRQTKVAFESIRSAILQVRADYVKSLEKPIQNWSRELDLSLLNAKIASRDEYPKIAILVPVKNAVPHLDSHLKLINALDYPKDKTRLVYAEGGSTDGTLVELKKFADDNPFGLAEVRVIENAPYYTVPRGERYLRSLQLDRRRTIAQARNHAIEFGLEDQDEWVLWLDADVVEAPANIIQTLLAENAKVVTPNCVREYGGPSFDMNAFFNTMGDDKDYHPKSISRRLTQPSANTFLRLHLSDLRYMDRVKLSSVGGTMLLVDANIHRAGLTFPEEPYRFLIETEAFGRMAKDLGIAPIGLPNVEILHAPD